MITTWYVVKNTLYLYLNPNIDNNSWQFRLVARQFQFFGEFELYLDVRVMQWRNILEEDLKRGLVVLWKTKAQCKILVFGWRLIHKSLSCLMELSNYGIINGRHNNCCPLNFAGDEDLEHMFLSCVVTSLCWKKFSNRIGVDLNSHAGSLSSHFSELKQILNLKFHVGFHWLLSLLFVGYFEFTGIPFCLKGDCL